MFIIFNILIKNEGNCFLTTVYLKESSIGLFTQTNSFTTMSDKIGFVRYLIRRAFKICKSYVFITKQKRLKFYYRKTCTLKVLLIIKLNPFQKNNSHWRVVKLLKNETHYIMAYHILDIFLITKRQLRHIFKRFYQTIYINIAISPLKLSRFFQL